MKLPGSIAKLHEQLAAVGWGPPSELKFDPDGNLVGISLRPLPSAPAAKKSEGKGVKRSALEIFGAPPEQV